MPGGTDPPLNVILSWPKPNYVNPETRGDGIVIYSYISASIATILVCLRLYARIFLLRKPGLDDVLVVVGLLFSTLLMALVLLGYYHYGIGTHIWDIPLTKHEPARFITWLSLYCTIISTSATKISILLFYRRLATDSYTRGFLWAVWAGILFNIAYCLGFVLDTTFQCTPIEAYWKHFNLAWGKPFHCAEESLSVPAAGALSVVGDFYATVLPAVLLRHLRIPTMQKILLYSLFGVGFLVVAAGVFRTYYAYRATNETYDITWTLWTAWIWTLAEMNLAIICASVPAIKPFWVKYISPVVHSAYSLVRSKPTPNNSSDYQDPNIEFIIPYSANSDKPQDRVVPVKRFSGLSHANDSQCDRLHHPGEMKDLEMGIVGSSDKEQVRERNRTSDESSGTRTGDVAAPPHAGECWPMEVSASQVGKAL